MDGAYGVFLVLLFVALAIKDCNATQHVVGGSQGWDQTTDMNSWASGRTFKVGDQLVFKYTPGLHSVVELAGESAYKNCALSSALNSMNGGNNVVKLDKPGTRFFTCGTSGHCGQGMKLKINTVAAGRSPSPSSSTPSTSAASTVCTYIYSAVLAVSIIAISILY